MWPCPSTIHVESLQNWREGWGGPRREPQPPQLHDGPLCPAPQGFRPGQSSWRCSALSSRCASSGAARVPAAARPGATRSSTRFSLPCPTNWSLPSDPASCDPHRPFPSVSCRQQRGQRGTELSPEHPRDTVISPRMFWAQCQDRPSPPGSCRGSGLHPIRHMHTKSPFRKSWNPGSFLQRLLLPFLLRCRVFEPWEALHASSLFSRHLLPTDTKASIWL